MAHISEAAPLQISRFYTGWYSYRNPLIVPVKAMGRRIIELYDSIWDGLNMECSNTLTLKRRPGYVLVNGDSPFGKCLYFYSFKPSNFPGQIYQVIDTTHDIEHFVPEELGKSTVLLFKQTTPLSNFASVGAYCYMAQELLAQKWDSPGGAQGVTKWGIEMYSSGFQQTHFPAYGTNLTGAQASPNPWLNPTSIQATDTLLSQVTLTRPSGSTTTVLSGWLLATGFLFNFSTIPHDLEIRGIVVTLIGVTVQGATQDIGLNVRLLRNEQLTGCYRTVTLPPNISTIIVGGANDLWDDVWTPQDINATLFGVAIQAVSNSDTSTQFSINSIQLSVYVVGKPNVVLGAASGLDSEVGYQYVYCYGNSHSGHISSPTIPSFYNPAGDIGPIAPHQQSVSVSLEASPDPQVTDIHVYRTTDGGGYPFFELPNSPVPNVPNTFTTLIDSAPDNELQIASRAPDPHFNDPPPGGAIDPVWFAGRLWMHRQHQLFFSSGPDVDTGNGEEAWYPVYTFAIPHGRIIRKFPTPNGLLLVTNDEILIVRGISTASFTINDFAKDIGMRAWTAGDSDGTNIYLYTSDRQFLLLNANGFTPVSQVIADQIAAVDPVLAYVAQFRYTARTNMVFVSDGSTYLYPFNQELQAWAVREQPLQGVDCIGSVEVTPGVYQFWRSRSIAPDNSLISQRDTTGLIFSDEGTAYPCHVVFGCIPLADMLTLAQIRDIALNQAATASTTILSALPNEIFPVADKQFEILGISSPEPPELSATPSLSFTANRYTWKSTPLPEHVNTLFFRIDFSADPNPDELYVWCLGGTQTTGGSSLGAPGQLPQLQGR